MADIFESTSTTPAGQVVERIAEAMAIAQVGGWGDLSDPEDCASGTYDPMEKPWWREAAIAALEALATPSVATPADDAGVRDDYVRFANDMLARLFYPSGATRDDAKPYQIARQLAIAVKLLAASPKAPSVAIDANTVRRCIDVLRGNFGAGRSQEALDQRNDDIAILETLLNPSVAIGAGEVERLIRGSDVPDYAADDISHLEGLASYLDGYARDKGKAGLPESRKLFDLIAKRLREYDAIRLAALAPASASTEQPLGALLICDQTGGRMWTWWPVPQHVRQEADSIYRDTGGYRTVPLYAAPASASIPADVEREGCTCQRFPTHQANDCPKHGLDGASYTAGEPCHPVNGGTL